MQAVRQLGLFVILLCMVHLPAQATSSVIDAHIDNPQLVGKSHLKVMFWKVFDASLHAESGLYNANEPFALSLRYLRSLDGKKIVGKSMEEIRRQEPGISKEQLARWETELLRIIPDVRNGTTITGVRTHDGHSVFYLDDDKIGSINELAFTKAFFDIWLGQKASEPEFRYRLLGGERNT